MLRLDREENRPPRPNNQTDRECMASVWDAASERPIKCPGKIVKTLVYGLMPHEQPILGGPDRRRWRAIGYHCDHCGMVVQIDEIADM